VPTIQLAVVTGLLDDAFRAGGLPPSWLEDMAPGETVARLLARLVSERPSFSRLYDANARRLAPGVLLTVNGRDFELVGGLTYFLHDGDRLTFQRDPTA
jgi:hypothetical protein